MEKIFFQILFFLATIVYCQASFEVLSLEGSAKVEHSQKHTWEDVNVGSKILDNDMVETFFQTKMILRFGENNIVILGSNSKALLNIVEKDAGGKTINDVSLTLFGGGIFTKAITGCHVSIYTPNAVGVMDSGSVSTVADAKTGETGFQVLGGLISVRNIAQQNGRELRSGLTTMILPNKEPTAPLYITYRHVAVLKHFFGDDYISSELDASGIKPTEEAGAGNRYLLSQNLKSSSNVTDEGMYKDLFSINKIYGSILDDEMKNAENYIPLADSRSASDNVGNLEFISDFAICSQGLKPAFILTPSFRKRAFGAALRLSFSQNFQSKMMTGFTSLEGLLDKVDYVFIKMGSSSNLYLGEISNYTLGNGLVVNDFSNENVNSVYHSLGFNSNIRINDNLKIKTYLADLSLPLAGGLYLDYSPPLYHFGVGYYFDFNQYKFHSDESSRFTSLSSKDSVFKLPVSNVHIYELNLGVDVISNYDYDMELLFEFAQKLLNGNDGFVTRAPFVIMNYKKTCFGGGLLYESGRLPAGQFSSFYFSNRERLIQGDEKLNSMDTLLTQNTALSSRRNAFGISLFFQMNPFRGSDINFSLQQNFRDRNSFVVFRPDSSDTSRSASIPDFSYNLKFSINEDLVKFLKYAEAYVSQIHGALYPSQGSYFSSWGFESGFSVLTKPLFLNLSLEIGGKFYYLDTGAKINNVVESDDNIFEFYAGLQWGFL